LLDVAESENTVEAREESMRIQLAGQSAAVSAPEAEAGLADAQRELADGRGSGYGVGFGYVKNFGSPNLLDGIQLEYVITDGEHVANLHVIISGTRLGILGYTGGIDDADGELRGWALDELYRLAGSIAIGEGRYTTLLMRHPLRLG
jgi:hypothetical protein